MSNFEASTENWGKTNFTFKITNFNIIYEYIRCDRKYVQKKKIYKKLDQKHGFMEIYFPLLRKISFYCFIDESKKNSHFL